MAGKSTGKSGMHMMPNGRMMKDSAMPKSMPKSMGKSSYSKGGKKK